jgi:hypothetical protein
MLAMGIPCRIVAVSAFIVLSACGGGESVQKTEGAPSPTALTTTPTAVAPDPEQTYVRASDDPRTHELTIIIRDRGRSYTAGTCAAEAPDEFADVLAFGGPNRRYENRPIKDAQFPIPRKAKPLADGTCEARMQVTLPYAPRYTAGIVQVGGGIPDAEDPTGDTKIVSKGDAQDVVLLNYPT